MTTKTVKLTDGDSYDVCKRGMQILREHGLNFEVEDREDPESINKTFADYDMPFDIRLCGREWYEVVRFDNNKDQG